MDTPAKHLHVELTHAAPATHCLTDLVVCVLLLSQLPPSGMPRNEKETRLSVWWGCSSVGRASDQHAADRFDFPGQQGMFLPESTCHTDSFTVSAHPRVQSNALTSARTLRSPCQSSVDYVNTKTHSMQRRMRSATLSQLIFPG